MTAVTEQDPMMESYDDPILCVVCQAGPEQADCAACAGRGLLMDIPYPERPWDEVAPNLWIGGHQYAKGYCYPQDRFDTVISLVRVARSKAFAPTIGVHCSVSMRDDDSPVDVERVDALAAMVHRSLQQDRRVLVRCWAGLNRSSLVAGTALIRHQGWTAEDYVRRVREIRSPFALFNRTFVEHLSGVR